MDRHHHPSMQRVNWLELPDHILSIIANMLILAKDFIRFGAVCHPWHKIFNQNRYHLSRQSPIMLMFAELDLNPHDDQTRLLYNTADNRELNFRAPVPHDRLIRGFSHGWLVTVVDGNCERDSLISLVNPVLPINNEIQLPPFTYKGDIFKVVLSANPVSNPNYVAMAIYGNINTKLAFLKPGDKDWTSIQICLDYGDYDMVDVIYYRDQFCFVSTSGDIFSCDLNSPHPSLSIVICAPIPMFCYRRNLVELSTNLFQVIEHKYVHFASDDEDDEDGGDYFQIGFSVFKLDLVELKWNRMDNLHGHALFLGDHHSVSLLVSDFPECMPNTIYYIDDYGDWLERLLDDGGIRNIGAFNLDDRTTELVMCRTMISNPTWIEPAL